MIKNERQYRITRAQADKFARAIEDAANDEEQKGVHPVLIEAQRNALQSQLADLQNELEEYEALQEGRFDDNELKAIAGLPDALIKARIAKGLTQKELAERLGLKEQQVQRYEATGYASASVTRVNEVVHALGYNPSDLSDPQAPHNSRNRLRTSRRQKPSSSAPR